MSQYHITNTPIQIVRAGDPQTLIINHSTKNTLNIGNTNGVGIGTGVDITPLDPYSSIVVNGQEDVWGIEAVPGFPVDVLAQTNALLWTPKAVQPNIADPASPWQPAAGIQHITVNPPPEAQGIAIFVEVFAIPGQLTVSGVQSGIQYASITLNSGSPTFYEIPVLSDIDSQVTIGFNSATNGKLVLTWIMNPFVVTPVPSGSVIDVNIANVTLPGSNPLPVQDTGLQLVSNKQPVSVNRSLAAAASFVVIPGVVGQKIYLHEIMFDIDPGGAATATLQIQDSGGVTIATMHPEYVGAATGTFVPSRPSINFHGAALGSGLGLQINNAGGAGIAVFGTIVYSQG